MSNKSVANISTLRKTRMCLPRFHDQRGYYQAAIKTVKWKKSLTRFCNCDRQKKRVGTLPHQRRWVSASKQTSITCAWRECQAHGNEVRERKMTLKLHSRTLLQDSASLSANSAYLRNRVV